MVSNFLHELQLSERKYEKGAVFTAPVAALQQLVRSRSS